MSDGPRKKPDGDGRLADIMTGLDGIFAALGEVMSEAAERLQAGESGEMRRTFDVETGRGPLRAEAGLRVRFATPEAGGAADPGRQMEQPINRAATGQNQTPRTTDREPQADFEAAGPETARASERAKSSPRSDATTVGDNSAETGMDTGRSTGSARPTAAQGQIDAAPRRPRPIDYTIFEDASAWRLTADIPGVGREDLELKIEGETLLIETRGARWFQGAADVPAGTQPGDLEISLRNGILELAIRQIEEPDP